MYSQPIFRGSCISIRPITPTAIEFLLGLDKRELRDLNVAATILDNSLCRGRPPGGRSERVEDSKGDIWELRITPPGRKGTHTRALYICEERELLVLRGVRKAERGIPRRAIELADRDARTYRRQRDDSSGRRPRGSP